MNNADVIVIGAGASGLIAAGIAAQQGKSVLLLEKKARPAIKLSITGKGRCNVTNSADLKEFVDVPEYLSFWPYLKSDSEIGVYARGVQRRFSRILQESVTAASESFGMDSYSRLRSSRTTNAFYESLDQSLRVHRIAEKYTR